jgi:hypothetical protein
MLEAPVDPCDSTQERSDELVNGLAGLAGKV